MVVVKSLVDGLSESLEAFCGLIKSGFRSLQASAREFDAAHSELTAYPGARAPSPQL